MQAIGELIPKHRSEEWERISNMTPRERAIHKMELSNMEPGTRNEEDGYDCPICLNRGYSWGFEDKPPYKDTVIPCKCEGVRASIRRMKRSGLEPVLKRCTFDKYEAPEAWQQTLKEKAQAFPAAADDLENKWFFMGGGVGCVDCDTEYFNGSEWVRIADYKNGDKVLQFDSITGKGTLTTPEDYIVAPSNELYLLTTDRKHIDMCLSANHNFAYITSKGHMQKKPFAEVMEMHNKSKLGFYGLVETAFNYSGNGIDLTENEIRLMCAVIADGSFKSSTTYCIVNVKKERKKERMRKLLENMDYKEYKRSNGYSAFRFYAPRREKEFTEFWYGCSNEQLKIIADEVFYWDGSISGKRRQFCSTSKKSADFVQFALSATGTRCTIGTDNHKEKTCYVVIASSHGSKVPLRTKGGRKKPTITRVNPADGKQYCFTVETGYLILRRNGRIFITGNSGKTHLCTAMAREFLLQGKEVRYMLWVEEVAKLNAAVTDEPVYRALIEPLKTVEVLYIDDFFKPTKDNRGQEMKPTAGDLKRAYEIIDYRYQHRDLITIISSERHVHELEEIDSAVGSRIYEMTKENAYNIAKTKDRNYRLRDMVVI